MIHTELEILRSWVLKTGEMDEMDIEWELALRVDKIWIGFFTDVAAAILPHYGKLSYFFYEKLVSPYWYIFCSANDLHAIS